MPDQSQLDSKYFVTRDIYNCPFCKRRHVSYSVLSHSRFNWSEEKICHIYLVRCNSCAKTSMHLSFSDLSPEREPNRFRSDLDLDSQIFYSVPTSFFVLDTRINQVLRDLITEAEGCLKMNFL